MINDAASNLHLYNKAINQSIQHTLYMTHKRIFEDVDNMQIKINKCVHYGNDVSTFFDTTKYFMHKLVSKHKCSAETQSLTIILFFLLCENKEYSMNRYQKYIVVCFFLAFKLMEVDSMFVRECTYILNTELLIGCPFGDFDAQQSFTDNEIRTVETDLIHLFGLKFMEYSDFIYEMAQRQINDVEIIVHEFQAYRVRLSQEVPADA
jgi:hypothetical protein